MKPATAEIGKWVTVVMTTEHHMPVRELHVYMQCLVEAGHPQETIENLLVEKKATWTEPDVRTTYRIIGPYYPEAKE